MNNVYVGTLLFLAGCWFSLTWELAKFKEVFLYLLFAFVALVFCCRGKRRHKKRNFVESQHGSLSEADFSKREEYSFLKSDGLSSCFRQSLVAHHLTIPVSICFLLAGLWAGSNAPAKPAESLQDYFGQEVLAYGSIEPASVKRYEYGTSFVLRCESLHVQETFANANSANFQKQLVNEEKDLQGKFQEKENRGEVPKVNYQQNLRVFTKNKELPLSGKVWCKGKLLPLHSLRNPGGFEGERWNYLQGLGGRLTKAEAVVISEACSLPDKFAVGNIRLREKITSCVQGQAGAVLAGMTLGGSVGLDDATREAFTANGLVHLLSVSGTHMVLLTGFLLLVLRPLPNRWRKFFILLVLVAYALLCGLRPPVVRALCMSAVLLCGGSGAKRGNLLCLLGVMFLIFKPLWLLDLGFQLSFGAVAGIICLYPKLKDYFCGYLFSFSNYMPVILGEALALTLAAQLAVLPLLVGYFHQVSLVGFASNILLVPILELATILTLCACVVTFADFVLSFAFAKFSFAADGLLLENISYFGELLLEIAGWLTQQVLVQAGWLASLPYSVLVIGSLPLWCGVVYYFALLLCFDLPCVNFLRNKERKLLLSGTVLCLAIYYCWKSFAPQPFTAYFLDVGQGDCAVVVTPQRKVLVVDTGGLKNYDTGSKVLAPFLRNLGKSKIDLLLLSHADYDHAGGTLGLARNVAIEQIVLPAEKTLSKKEISFKKDREISVSENLLVKGYGLTPLEISLLTEAKPAKVERAMQGKRYLFAETVVEILDVPTSSESSYASSKESSTVAAVHYGGHSLLFTGDIDAARESKLQNLGKYDVLKVAHHGSKHSSSQKFLEKVSPSVAVVSVGAGNKYGHPHTATLERLASVGSKVLRTDELGAVQIIFDEEKIKIKTTATSYKDEV